jgi:hypothetical protein
VLTCDFKPFRDTEILRSIRTLETINDKPAAKFWKEVEKKQAAFAQWMRDVGAMPAEKQVEAVSKKLQELNKGFDGKVPHDIAYSAVTTLIVVTDFVTDISPVRALVGLKVLNCSSSKTGTGKLFDLSPLKGMSLSNFACNGTQVSDLSPLKEMPLIHLQFADTRVSDLTPLGEMQLQTLICTNTNVDNLAPLTGMPLTMLYCNFIEVSDLSPLRGMQLSYLNCSDTQVSDLTPLKGMPLTDLSCHRTQVSDLSPLKHIPIQRLSLDFNLERDTEILRSIKTLETINNKPAAEFWKEVEKKQAGQNP